MVNYDKFEVFMINRISEWAQKLDREENRTQVEVFSELIVAFYEYEKEKIDGDISAY